MKNIAVEPTEMGMYTCFEIEVLPLYERVVSSSVYYGNVLRSAKDARKSSSEDAENDDLESNSSESEGSMEELDEETSDSDQYQPSLWRINLRGRGYTNTGIRQ